MGTRAVISVRDKENKKVVEIYKQFDGYPDGLGYSLEKFLKDKYLVNGFRLENGLNQVNGMKDLGIRLVTYLKNEEISRGLKLKFVKEKSWDSIGNLYIYNSDCLDSKCYREDCGAEYVYKIYPGKDREIILEAYNDEGLMYTKVV